VYQLPKFLAIRFAPGAGANFLISVLQCSNGVGHWIPELEYNKDQTNWLEYFQEVFSSNLGSWLDREPASRNHLGVKEIFSAKFPRGNNLSVEDFAQQEAKCCSPHYFDLKNKNAYIPVFWNKVYVPDFFASATYINIMLDRSSLKWFDRSVYYKHYNIESINVDGSVTVRCEEHLPKWHPKNFNFGNQHIKTFPSYRKFLQEEIFANHWRQQYLDPSCFDTTPKNQPQFTINLSDILDFKKFQLEYVRLCNFLNIATIDIDMLKSLHSCWMDCHPYNKKLQHPNT